MSASMENARVEPVPSKRKIKSCLGEYGQHYECAKCPERSICQFVSLNTIGKTRRYKGKYKGRGKYRGRDVY